MVLLLQPFLRLLMASPWDHKMRGPTTTEGVVVIMAVVDTAVVTITIVAVTTVIQTAVIIMVVMAMEIIIRVEDEEVDIQTEASMAVMEITIRVTTIINVEVEEEVVTLREVITNKITNKGRTVVEAIILLIIDATIDSKSIIKKRVICIFSFECTIEYVVERIMRLVVWPFWPPSNWHFSCLAKARFSTCE